jgi:hypothetical protein
MPDEKTSPNPNGGGQEPSGGEPAANDKTAGAVQDGGASGGSKLTAQFPKDYRHLVEGYGDMKSFMADVEKAFGSQGVQVPGEDASEEEINEFYTKLGKPKSKDGYELTAPEGTEENKELKQWFTEAAHTANLTNAQAQALYSRWNEAQKAKREAAAKEVRGELTKEWGEETEKNIERADRVAELIGGEAFKRWLRATGAGNDINFIKGMHRVAELVGEDTLERGSGKSGGNEGEQRRSQNGMPLLDFSKSFPKKTG